MFGDHTVVAGCWNWLTNETCEDCVVDRKYSRPFQRSSDDPAKLSLTVVRGVHFQLAWRRSVSSWLARARVTSGNECGAPCNLIERRGR